MAGEAPVEPFDAGAGAGADEVVFLVEPELDFDEVDFEVDFDDDFVVPVDFHVVDPPEDLETLTLPPLAMAAAWAWRLATVARSFATCAVLASTADCS